MTSGNNNKVILIESPESLDRIDRINSLEKKVIKLDKQHAIDTSTHQSDKEIHENDVSTISHLQDTVNKLSEEILSANSQHVKDKAKQGENIVSCNILHQEISILNKQHVDDVQKCLSESSIKNELIDLLNISNNELSACQMNNRMSSISDLKTIFAHLAPIVAAGIHSVLKTEAINTAATIMDIEQLTKYDHVQWINSLKQRTLISHNDFDVTADLYVLIELISTILLQSKVIRNNDDKDNIKLDNKFYLSVAEIIAIILSYADDEFVFPLSILVEFYLKAKCKSSKLFNIFEKLLPGTISLTTFTNKLKLCIDNQKQQIVEGGDVFVMDDNNGKYKESTSGGGILSVFICPVWTNGAYGTNINKDGSTNQQQPANSPPNWVNKKCDTPLSLYSLESTDRPPNPNDPFGLTYLEILSTQLLSSILNQLNDPKVTQTEIYGAISNTDKYVMTKVCNKCGERYNNRKMVCDTKSCDELVKQSNGQMKLVRRPLPLLGEIKRLSDEGEELKYKLKRQYESTKDGTLIMETNPNGDLVDSIVNMTDSSGNIIINSKALKEINEDNEKSTPKHSTVFYMTPPKLRNPSGYDAIATNIKE
jgi:hypothetical protein